MIYPPPNVPPEAIPTLQLHDADFVGTEQWITNHLVIEDKVFADPTQVEVRMVLDLLDFVDLEQVKVMGPVCDELSAETMLPQGGLCRGGVAPEVAVHDTATVRNLLVKALMAALISMVI